MRVERLGGRLTRRAEMWSGSAYPRLNRRSAARHRAETTVFRVFRSYFLYRLLFFSKACRVAFFLQGRRDDLRQVRAKTKDFDFFSYKTYGPTSPMCIANIPVSVSSLHRYPISAWSNTEKTRQCSVLATTEHSTKVPHNTRVAITRNTHTNAHTGTTLCCTAAPGV